MAAVWFEVPEWDPFEKAYVGHTGEFYLLLSGEGEGRGFIFLLVTIHPWQSGIDPVNRMFTAADLRSWHSGWESLVWLLELLLICCGMSAIGQGKPAILVVFQSLSLHAMSRGRELAKLGCECHPPRGTREAACRFLLTPTGKPLGGGPRNVWILMTQELAAYRTLNRIKASTNGEAPSMGSLFPREGSTSTPSYHFILFSYKCIHYTDCKWMPLASGYHRL